MVHLHINVEYVSELFQLRFNPTLHTWDNLKKQ
jgi:hypothetical protein